LAGVRGQRLQKEESLQVTRNKLGGGQKKKAPAKKRDTEEDPKVFWFFFLKKPGKRDKEYIEG